MPAGLQARDVPTQQLIDFEVGSTAEAATIALRSSDFQLERRRRPLSRFARRWTRRNLYVSNDAPTD